MTSLLDVQLSLNLSMKRFVLVFVLGVVIFLSGHVISAIIRSDDPDAPDSADRYGFPFLVFAEKFYHDPQPYFSRMALWANIGFSFLTGSLFVWSMKKVLVVEAKRPD